MNFQLLFSIIILLQSTVKSYNVEKRVINGIDADEDKYKWAASIKGDITEKEYIVHCGATIISNQWLLTAAHCFIDKENSKILNYSNPKRWHIRAGSKLIFSEYISNEHDSGANAIYGGNEIDMSFLEELENDYQIVDKRSTSGRNSREIHIDALKIIVHPQYNEDIVDNDIALIKLKKPFSNGEIRNRLKIVELPEVTDTGYWPQVDQTCVLVGWGCQQNKGDLSSHGQLATLNVTEWDTCYTLYEGGASLNRRSEFCAGTFRKKHGICEGDSGSGLICKKSGEKLVIAGIASATHAENPQDYPGIFTKVSYFVPWIKNTMNQE